MCFRHLPMAIVEDTELGRGVSKERALPIGGVEYV
jgi:hypothetical protein